MIEWVLLIFFYTSNGVGTMQVPGFATQSECAAADSSLKATVRATDWVLERRVMSTCVARSGPHVTKPEVER